MRLTPQDIAALSGGALVLPAHPADCLVEGFCWDSREVEPGCLYVALPGARVDGHDFVPAAIRAGAACVLVSRELDAQTADAARVSGVAVVRVDDTAAAFTRLAAGWRARLRGTVVAITGSSGKTTTKGLVRDVLSAAGSVCATIANQNNELGVPATLLRADEDTAHVVVEMGMRGLGQIEALCRFVRPDWALITNVGTSHMELLGSRDNIARAKAEAFDALPDGGLAFICASDDYAVWLASHVDELGRGIRPVFYEGGSAWPHEDELGITEGYEPFVWAENITYDESGCASFTMQAIQFDSLGGSLSATCACTLALPGAHNVSNACGAAAVGLAAGLSLEACCAALGAARAEAGRSNVIAAPGGFTVVDDAYNANPDSCEAALKALAHMKAAGDKVAVLGDMGELGAISREGHERVGRLAAQTGVDALLCVGPLSRDMARAAREAGLGHVEELPDAAAALARLRETLAPGDCVLVKASHSTGLDAIVKGLVQLDA